MALGYTTNSIHTKLDDLSLSSPKLEALESMSPKFEPFSTKSLLSKSLAGDSSFRHKPSSPQMFASIDAAELRDEHPEPPLLATSVGNDLEGRFLPSSSTISLLSLSNNSHNNSRSNVATIVSNDVSQTTSIMGNPPNYIDLHFSQNKPTAQTFTTTSIERGNSFSNLRSRNFHNLSGQQRLQPYQKVSSPAIPSGPEFMSFSSPQNIPLKRNFSSLFTPSSPSLDPTSVANSPSGFWLSSQTPPRGTNSASKVKGVITTFGNNYQTAPMAGATFSENQGSLHLVSKHINIQRSGGDSPILHPVQTPIEDMPMTPLYLNSDSNSYFVIANSQSGHRGRTSVSYGFTTEGIDEKEELNVNRDMDLNIK